MKVSLTFRHQKKQCSLKELQSYKSQKSSNCGLIRLQKMYQTYSTPFLPQVKTICNQDPEIIDSNNSNNISVQFVKKALKLCQQLFFQVLIFKKLFSASQRKKAVMQKLYGWDKQHFQNLLFVKEELKDELTAEYIFAKLGFKSQNFKSRNIYNKLRLFSSELVNFNRKQQDLDTQFQKKRLDDCFTQLDQEFLLINHSQRHHLKPYLNHMKNTHNQMLTAKLKIHNKADQVKEIAKKLGKIQINQFYLKQEKDVSEIEQFFKKSHKN